MACNVSTRNNERVSLSTIEEACESVDAANRSNLGHRLYALLAEAEGYFAAGPNVLANPPCDAVCQAFAQLRAVAAELVGPDRVGSDNPATADDEAILASDGAMRRIEEELRRELELSAELLQLGQR